MADYILLTNSNSSLIKRFRLTQYTPVVEKGGARRVTVTGKIDNQVGPALTRFQMVVRVYETDPTDPTKSDSATTGYGTYAHLETFFGYDTPGATPSNVITLTDFDGVTTYSVYLVGTFSPRRLGTAVEGTCAVFDVPIQAVETS